MCKATTDASDNVPGSSSMETDRNWVRPFFLGCPLLHCPHVKSCTILNKELPYVYDFTSSKNLNSYTKCMAILNSDKIKIR